MVQTVGAIVILPRMKVGDVQNDQMVGIPPTVILSFMLTPC